MPAKIFDMREIAVGGAENQSMLDRQSGEMGIRDEVRLRAGRFQELAEHIAMPLRRLWYPGYLAGKSCFDLFPCVHHRRSHLEDA